MIKFIYLHGLHGSNSSKKFIELQKKYPEIQCLEWSIDDNIENKIVNWSKVITDENPKNVCIIASSTGCNFAYQLKNFHKTNWISLVLINPLFDVKDIYNQDLMPANISNYLVKVTNLSGALILFGNNDEVIDNQKHYTKDTFIGSNNKIIIDSFANHGFANLADYYNEIDSLIDSIYL